MPKVSYHKEERIRSVIRDAMAIDPLISIPNLQKIVEKKLNRAVDHVYISKLVKSVSGAMAVVADREKVEERIEYLRETNRVVRNELFRIAYPSPTDSPQPTITERMRALKYITDIDRAQAKIEMDMGLFTRQIGTVKVEGSIEATVRNIPLEPETWQSMARAFKAWGFKPPQPRKIEVVDAVVVNKTNDQPTTLIDIAPAPKPTPTGGFAIAD